VYVEMMMSVKNHQALPTIRPGSDLSLTTNQSPAPDQLANRHGTRSLGHRVNGSSFTSGSPGHHFDPV